MDNRFGTGSGTEASLSSILNTAIGVITNPVGFFKSMPKSGGLAAPLIFAVVVGTAAGVVRTLLGILGIGFIGSFFMALTLIVITPILVAIFSFVGGAIMFIIWKVMGSQEEFETAFRCGAYASAIGPIIALLHIIPYVGAVLGLVWMMYLLVIASIEVHNIKAQKAWIVFGAICAIFAVLTLWSEHATRNLTSRMDQLQRQMQKTGEMSPEDAGKAVGEFLKGMQKGTDEKK